MQSRRLVVWAATPLLAAGLTFGAAGAAGASTSAVDQASQVSKVAAPADHYGGWQRDDHRQCRNHNWWERYKRYNYSKHRWEYQYRNTHQRCGYAR